MKALPPESAGAALAEAMRPFEQFLVADREERAPQRGEDRALVGGPLDRREGGADRCDLLALVKRAAADEHVRNAAGFEGLHVGPCHVRSEADEPPKQQADVFRGDGHRWLVAALGHLPL